MTKEQAYEKLELPVGTDLQVVRQKFQQMHNDFQVQIDGAFNEGMRQRKEQQLEELKEAYAVLNESRGMDDSASLPRTEKTFDQTGGEAKKQTTQQDSAPKEQQQAPPPPPRPEREQPKEQAPPVYTTPPAKNKSNAGLFIGIAAAVIVILAGFYFLSNRSRSPVPSTATADPHQDSIAWEAALASGNEGAYTHYIKQHPNGIFIEAAIDSLTQIKGADYVATVMEEAQKQAPTNTSTPDPQALTTVSNTTSATSSEPPAAAANTPKDANALFSQANSLDEKKRYKEAAALYQQAADLGDARAKYLLGVYYQEGTGVSKNQSTANSWYKQAFQELPAMANRGDAPAQAYLGHTYYFGRGTSESNTEAMKWYRKAADQGHKTAQNNIGTMYRYGQGVAKDEAEARRWYLKAANQGNVTAQRNLAQLYENKKEYLESNKWYLKAANQGDADSQYNLGINYDDGWGVEIDWKKAAEWYKKASDNGHNLAKTKLGEFYMFGVGGISQNKNTAERLFREAANAGSSLAKSYLEVIADIKNNKIHYLNTSTDNNRLFMTNENIAKHTQSMPWIITKHGASWSVEVSFEAEHENSGVQIWPIESARMDKPAPTDVIRFTNYTACHPMQEKSGVHSTGVSMQKERGNRAIAYMYVGGHFRGDLQEDLKIKVPYMVCWKPKNDY